jgi:hypothetical protein
MRSNNRFCTLTLSSLVLRNVSYPRFLFVPIPLTGKVCRLRDLPVRGKRILDLLQYSFLQIAGKAIITISGNGKNF